MTKLYHIVMSDFSFKWKMYSVTLLWFSFILKASQQRSGEGELLQMLYLPIVRDAFCHAQLSLNRNGQRTREELLLPFYREVIQTYNCSQSLGRLDITRNWMQPPEMQSRCFPPHEKLWLGHRLHYAECHPTIRHRQGPHPNRTTPGQKTAKHSVWI